MRNYCFCFRLISSESVVSRKLQLIWIHQMINMQKFKLNIFFNNNNVDFKLKTMHDYITCHLSHRDNEIKSIQVWLFQLKLKCWYTFFSPFEQTDRITNILNVTSLYIKSTALIRTWNVQTPYQSVVHWPQFYVHFIAA